MAALTKARNTPRLGPGEQILGSVDIALKAGAKVFQGGIVCIDSTGYGVAASAALGLIACGIFDSEKAAQPVLDNTAGASADLTARVQQGVFRLVNSGSTDTIAQADIGQVCFLVDDQTVAKTDGAGTRSPAGVIVGVDTSGVFVSFALQLAKMVESSGSSGTAPAEQISASGALSIVKRSSILAVSGTKAYTLANGTRVGQRKSIFCRSAASTPVGVVTPATPNNFATLTFSTVNGGAELEWNGASWDLVGIGGTVTVA